MKSLIWLPFVLLAGLLAGSLAPRLEAARQREEVARLRQELRNARGRASTLEGVLNVLRLDLREARRTAWNAEAESEPGEPRPDPQAADPDGEPDRRRRRRQLPERPLREQIETAADAWRIRSALARESLIERAGFDHRQAEDFDVLIRAMNMRLEHTVDQWVREFENTGIDPSAEDGLRMLHELTGVMVLTYDEMDRKMPGDWRDRSGDFELFSFIDPGVAMPLVRVEDRIRSGEGESN